MRVLIVHNFPDVRKGGGAETAIINQMKALLLMDIDSTVIYHNPFTSEEEEYRHFDIIHFHTIFFNNMSIQMLIDAAERGVPACLSLHDYWPFCSNRMLVRGFDAPCPATTGLCEQGCSFQQPQWFQDIVNTVPTVTFNDFSAAIFRRNGIHISAVIPHGIDTEEFSPPKDESQRDWSKIITVCASPDAGWKGMHILREALILSGLKATIVTGLPHHEVRDVLRAAGIFVLPSIYEETFALVVTEAMACGLGCIVTDVAGPKSQIINNVNGIIVPKKDPKALSEALQLLVNDRNLCQLYGKRARNVAANYFSLPEYGRRLKAFYQDVIDGRFAHESDMQRYP